MRIPLLSKRKTSGLYRYEGSMLSLYYKTIELGQEYNRISDIFGHNAEARRVKMESEILAGRLPKRIKS